MKKILTYDDVIKHLNELHNEYHHVWHNFKEEFDDFLADYVAQQLTKMNEFDKKGVPLPFAAEYTFVDPNDTNARVMPAEEATYPNKEPMAKTWYMNGPNVEVKLLKYLGNNQIKVQFGDDDCARFFSRRVVDLTPLNDLCREFIEKNVK